MRPYRCGVLPEWVDKPIAGQDGLGPPWGGKYVSLHAPSKGNLVMKRQRFDLFLVFTVLAALALLGVAVWVAVLRPQSNWHPAGLYLPSWRPSDFLVSSVFLLLTAFVCVVGGMHYDDRYYDA